MEKQFAVVEEVDGALSVPRIYKTFQGAVALGARILREQEYDQNAPEAYKDFLDTGRLYSADGYSIVVCQVGA